MGFLCCPEWLIGLCYDFAMGFFYGISSIDLFVARALLWTFDWLLGCYYGFSKVFWGFLGCLYGISSTVWFVAEELLWGF